jgi:ribonuclease VapC
MVLDTSALLVLLLDEPEAAACREALEEDETRLVSAATLLETGFVIEARKGEAGGRELDLLIHKAGIDVVAVDGEQVAEARRAWRRFGRGRHEARLNFGDCLAYALAATSGEPLLFKGDDFAKTDVARVSLAIE